MRRDRQRTGKRPMTEKQYTLTLTEDRAEWVYNALMAYRNNPIFDKYFDHG